MDQPGIDVNDTSTGNVEGSTTRGRGLSAAKLRAVLAGAAAAPSFPLLLLPLLLLLTTAVYAAGIGGPVSLQAEPALTHNPDLRMERLAMPDLLQAMLSGQEIGPLGRPLAMLSFAMNFWLWGEGIHSLHVSNLGLHLLNGVLIYVLTFLLLGSPGRLTVTRWHCIALLCSALWLLHPIQMSSVLVAVQRMNSLSTCFCLAGMVAYILGRRRQENDGRWNGLWAGSVFMCPLLAALSKENGALLPLYLMMIEFFFFQQSRYSWLARLWAPASVLLALAALLYLSVYGWDMHASTKPTARSYPKDVQSLISGKVLWEYIGMILVPTLGKFSIYTDDAVLYLSHHWYWPGLAALVACSLVLRRRAPLVAFGAAFFLVAHSMESVAMDLRLLPPLLAEHRNYLPSWGLLLPLSYYLLSLQVRVLQVTLALRCTAIILVMLFASLSWQRSAQWGSSPLEFYLYQLEYRPQSSRLHQEIGDWYGRYSLTPSLPAETRKAAYQKSIDYLLKAGELAKDETRHLFSMIEYSKQHHIQPPTNWYDELQYRLYHGKSLTPASATSLVWLLNCRTAGSCRIDPSTTEKLVEAALANRHIHRSLLKSIYHTLAYHYLLYYRDPHRSHAVIQQMLTLPGAEYYARRALIYIYLATGQVRLAQEELSFMRRRFWLRRYTRDFINMEQMLGTATGHGE